MSKVRVGDEIVATGMGDGGRHEVANLRHGLTLGHADMHQHAGLLAAGDSMGVGILLALSTGDHHFNVTAFEGLQILRGDLFLQRHQSVETILDHIVRHLFSPGKPTMMSVEICASGMA